MSWQLPSSYPKVSHAIRPQLPAKLICQSAVVFPSARRTKAFEKYYRPLTGRKHGDLTWCREARKYAVLRKVLASAVPDSVPGFELIKTPGTGSCLFQALAQGQHLLSGGKLLTGTELCKAGYDLRRSICLMLEKRRDEVEPFIPGDFIAYVSYMATEGVWGGEPELAMAVKVLQRPILVYRMARAGLFGSELVKSSEYGTGPLKETPPICLLFHINHYDLLRAKS